MTDCSVCPYWEYFPACLAVFTSTVDHINKFLCADGTTCAFTVAQLSVIVRLQSHEVVWHPLKSIYLYHSVLGKSLGGMLGGCSGFSAQRKAGVLTLYAISHNTSYLLLVLQFIFATGTSIYVHCGRRPIHCVSYLLMHAARTGDCMLPDPVPHSLQNNLPTSAEVSFLSNYRGH